MEFKFRQLNEDHTVTIQRHKDGYMAVIDGEQYRIDDFRLEGNLLFVKLDGVQHRVYCARGKGTVHVAVGSEHYSFSSTKDAKTARATAAQSADSVSSPMPGLVVKIPVAVGDRVTAGQTLAIVEAMKMQNELFSPRDGTVRTINVREGDQVDALQPIVDLEKVVS